MSGARPTLWRYSALGESGLVRGEHQGASPAEVRSALHSAGLRVLDLRPLRVPGAQADDRPTTCRMTPECRPTAVGRHLSSQQSL